MRSILRFVIFAIVLGALVASVYLWRRPSPTVEPAISSRLPSLESLDGEFTRLVAKTLPSVVSITAVPVDAVDPRMNILRRFLGGGPESSPAQLGSGVIVSKEGHIITNFHVISGAGAVEVNLADGRVERAKYLGGDAISDIAILKIDADGLDALPFGDSDAVQVGQMVFAIGNPLGLQETVTQGIISAKGRRTSSEAANEFFQTDAAINRGNSGGPLVNLRGELIGINNQVTVSAQGIAFAIPANTVRRVFESIRDNGRFIRPWFGAYMRSLSPQLAHQLKLPDTVGALILMTYAGSPAEEAGLQPGDVIVAINGRPVRDVIDLRNRVAEVGIGDTVSLRVRRGASELDLKTKIASEPQT